MRVIALLTIRAYQRYLSPLKGFCCAYGAHTGRRTCSALGYRAIQRYGVRGGLLILRRRLYLCGVAYRRHATPVPRPPRAQRGDCDLGCDLPCDLSPDLPGCKSGSSARNLISCCDCGSCDWPDRKKKDREQERGIHIPSYRGRSPQRGGAGPSRHSAIDVKG